MVVNWAGPVRADVILGKSGFLPLSHSVFHSLFSSSLLISWISPEKRRCGVYCSSKEKESSGFSSDLLAYGCRVWVHLCVHVCSPAPPVKIRLNATALAQHKLGELV